MNLIEATLSKLSNVQYYLEVLGDTAYNQGLEVLSFASIGEHTRHIIEFYQCLIDQCPGGEINYDERKRNQVIEKSTIEALESVANIIDKVKNISTAQPVKLVVNYDPEAEFFESVQTSVERELVYNLEHVIHHLALIKIGLTVIAPGLQLPDGFGVAPSTIKYQKSTCAQ